MTTDNAKPNYHASMSEATEVVKKIHAPIATRWSDGDPIEHRSMMMHEAAVAICDYANREIAKAIAAQF